ncbi:MAG TPA: AAA family ATPase [Solirubrobacteraceae bacterium]|jgi:ATP-dependent exoDNAse (exonuclease V) alpha subunit|nr:AAA family ATPase [Solirubrobacteraceae bacterium]
MQGIALATRHAKTYDAIDGERWRDEARARAAEHGFGPAELRTLIARAAEPRSRPHLGAAVARLSGPDGLTATHNTFARRHALAEIAGEFTDGLPLVELEQATDAYLADPSIHALPTAEPAEARFTTQGLLACERSILDSAERRRATTTAALAPASVQGVLSGARPQLNEDQAAAVRAIATSGNGIDHVQALAGTGKTTMLRALAQAHQQAGYQVIGAAPTARAARELRESAGVRAGTLHSLLAQLERSGGFPTNTVLLLDEAGSASTRLSARIFQQAEASTTKIVAVGDPGQLPSVQAGGWLAALSAATPGRSYARCFANRTWPNGTRSPPLSSNGHSAARARAPPAC